MEIKEKIDAIPNSYDDFVMFTSECMERDEHINDAILTQLRDYPDSDVNDITKVLCDCLGIGEPITLIDDVEDDMHYSVSGARVAY